MSLKREGINIKMSEEDRPENIERKEDTAQTGNDSQPASGTSPAQQNGVENHPQPLNSENQLKNEVKESSDDELQRLRKENERLKEIQRLKEENAGLSAAASATSTNPFKGSRNLILIAAGTAAIAVVLIVLVFGLQVFSGTSSLRPSVNANASGVFFLGPSGQSLGSTYINGLSGLDSQLAQVGAEQLNGQFEYVPYGCSSQANSQPNSTICNPSQGYSPSAGYYVLVYGNGTSQNYDIIPIPVPSNFSNYSISKNGKPTFVYIGAQGCPFCAGMRWSIAIALSRFGNFTKLFYDRSATTDANVPTLMFNFSQTAFEQSTAKPAISTASGPVPYGDGNPTPFSTGSYYTSKYINFESLDEMGGSFLVNITGIEQINPVIYSNIYVNGMHNVNSTSSGVVSANGFGIQNFFIGGVPFFNINNQYVFDGAIVNARTYLTSTGLNPAYSTHSDILNSIKNPVGGSFGQTAIGAANILTAQICKTLNNTAPVCSLPYIVGLEAKLAALNYSREY